MARAERNITEKQIERLRYRGVNGARCAIWDREVRGFGVRVYPADDKSYVLSFRWHGRKEMRSLGSVSLCTVEDARIRAKRRLLKLADGKHPFDDIDAIDNCITFSQFAPIFMSEYSKIQKKSWKKG